MLTGAIVVTVVAFICGYIVSVRKTSIPHRAHAAMLNNCMDLAELETSECDDVNNVYYCTYRYQYRGVPYTYQKTFFKEEPPLQLKLYWDKGKPKKPFEDTQTSVADTMHTLLIAEGAAALIAVCAFAGFCHLTLLFLTLGMTVWMMSAGKVGKVVAVAELLIALSFIPVWMDSNLPQSYNYSAERHEELQAEMRHLGEMTEYEVYKVYERVDWLNQDIKYTRSARLVPFIGQLEDKFTAELELLVWPEEYAQYESATYRDKIWREHEREMGW